MLSIIPCIGICMQKSHAPKASCVMPRVSLPNHTAKWCCVYFPSERGTSFFPCAWEDVPTLTKFFLAKCCKRSVVDENFLTKSHLIPEALRLSNFGSLRIFCQLPGSFSRPLSIKYTLPTPNASAVLIIPARFLMFFGFSTTQTKVLDLKIE